MSQLPLINTRQMSSAREMRRVKRERVVKELGLKRGDLARQTDPDFTHTEFNLKDESRNWPVSVGLCPICNIHGPHEMRVLCLPGGTKEFVVQCDNSKCGHKTPAYGTAKDAIRHWKLVARMSR